MFGITSHRLNNAVARFRRREDGSIAVETMIIIPILFWAFLAMLVIFDAYRQHSINQKAAYTIGDLVSRQHNAIDFDFISGTRALFNTLTRSSVETGVRITSVRYDETNNIYLRDWSEAVGSASSASADEVAGWAANLPIMPDGEFITVLETWSRYQAPFSIGIETHDIHNFVFTRPRNSPKICWNICYDDE